MSIRAYLKIIRFGIKWWALFLFGRFIFDWAYNLGIVIDVSWIFEIHNFCATAEGQASAFVGFIATFILALLIGFLCYELNKEHCSCGKRFFMWFSEYKCKCGKRWSKEDGYIQLIK